MAISRQQITARGIAQQSGLDTFSSIINYTGEYVNFGNAFAYGVQLNSDTDYATTTATPHIGALVNNPPSVINQWYRYHSSGSLYTNAGSASSGSGLFNLPAITTGGLPSYCGMYQKLLLIPSKEYKISIQTSSDSANIGILNINTYTPSGSGYVLSSTTSKELPNSGGSLGLVESTFTAVSSNDILLIYSTTEETSTKVLTMSSISISEEQEYLIPLYATDMWGNAHRVLRVAADQTIQEGDESVLWNTDTSLWNESDENWNE
jgi:hypothetical protein